MAVMAMTQRRTYRRRQAPQSAYPRAKYTRNIYRSIKRIRSKQTHSYKRFTSDIILRNTSVAGFSDIIFNVMGGDVGKDYNSMHLTNLFASVNNTSAIGGALGFQLNDLPNYTDFTALYDKYKLKYVKLRIIPLSNVANTNNLGVLPTVTYCLDQDDSALPGSEEEIREYGNCKVRRLDKPVTIKIKPHMKVAALDATGNVKRVVSPPKYLDLADNTVPHYGCKFWIDNVVLGPTTSVTALFKIVLQYYFDCSQTR